jgi:hypothetical protein
MGKGEEEISEIPIPQMRNEKRRKEEIRVFFHQKGYSIADVNQKSTFLRHSSREKPNMLMWRQRCRR